MVDRLITDKKRAQEYSVVTERVVKTVQDRLRQKGLARDSGKVNPLNFNSYNFEMSSDYETGVTTFEISFVGAFNEGEMRYVFKDGKVKKEGHTYADNRSIHDGERYYGEYTQEEIDSIIDGDYPEDLPRDDVFFNKPLPVEIRELRKVSQIIDLLVINPKRAEELVCELPLLG